MRFADLLLRLQGSSSGETVLRGAAAASGTITLPAGTTDFSATGGTSQVVRQSTAGGAFTVGQLAAADVSGALASNQTITLSGDIAGSGTTAIATTLPTVNATTGTFNNITINAKGLATAGSNTAYLTGNQTITLSGDIAGSGATAITATLPNVNANVGTFQGLTVNAKGQVTAAANQSYLTSSGVSGMTAGQLPVAAGAATITSSVPYGTTGNNTVVQTGATGVLAAGVMPAHTGDVTSPAGSTVNTLATVTVAKGGTGLTSGTSGGIPAFTGATTIASSGALTASAIVMGGGAGAAPSTENSWTFNNHELRGNLNSAPIETGSITTGGWSSILHVAAADGAESDVFLDSYGGVPSSINFRSARGTGGSPSATLSGNILGQFGGWGYGATGFCTAPRSFLRFTATENWTNTAQGASIVLSGTANGALANAPVATFQVGVVVGAPTGGDKGAGTLNATAVYANGTALTSDSRLKRDIEPLPEGCLALVAAIEPKRFRFIPREDGPPGFWERRHWGFVAQDIGAVMAGHDFGGYIEDDGLASYSPEAMIAVLWKANQELAARLEALEAKLGAV